MQRKTSSVLTILFVLGATVSTNAMATDWILRNDGVQPLFRISDAQQSGSVNNGDRLLFSPSANSNGTRTGVPIANTKSLTYIGNPADADVNGRVEFNFGNSGGRGLILTGAAGVSSIQNLSITGSGNSNGAGTLPSIVYNEQNLTVSNGRFHDIAITFSTQQNSSGGAINNVGNLTINNNSTFTDNTVVRNGSGTGSMGSGGAIFNTNGGKVTINGTSSNKITFSNNSAFQGGAIANVRGTGGATPSALDITYASFSNNKFQFGGAAIDKGGAIFNDDLGFNIGAGTSFATNNANNGGAIYNNHVSGTGTNIIAGTLTDKVTFTGNTAQQSGGAIYNNGNGGVLTISNTEFNSNSSISNSTTNGGGAIYNNTATVNLSDTSFAGNSATNNGGAIYNTSGATLNINGGSTFGGNSAAVNGGAIYNAGSLFINSTTGNISFYGNTANNTGNDIYTTSVININGTANDVYLGGGITGSGTINKSGAGRLLLDGDNSGYTGSFTQTSGTTVLSGSMFNNTSNINGGSLNIDDFGSLSASSILNIGASGTVNLITSDDFTIDGSRLTGTGAFNKTGDGILYLTDVNSGYTGTFTQSAGSTIVSGQVFSGTNVINGGNMSIITGATLASTSVLNIGSAGTINLTSNDNYTLTNGKLTGTGAFNKTGTGDLNITGDNSTFTGDFTQTAGTTYVSGVLFGGNNNINGGTLEIDTDGNWATTSVINLGTNGTMELQSHDTYTLGDGQLNGTGAFNFAAPGVLNITGDNSGFTGDFTQSSSGAETILTGVMFGGNSNINQGILEIATGGSLFNESFINLASTATMNITSDDDLEFSGGQVIGTGLINKTGNGDLNLTGNLSNFTGNFVNNSGDTNVIGGILFGGVNVINFGNINIENGGNIADGSTIDIEGTSALNINTDQDVTLADNQVTGDGTLTKNGTGDLNITGASNSNFTGNFTQTDGDTNVSGKLFAGTNTINGGNLNIINGGSWATTSIIDLGTDGVLNLLTDADSGLSAGQLTGTGTFNKDNVGTLDINGDMSGFTGDFNQTVGSTYINNGPGFGGNNNINGGNMEIFTGGELASTAVMNIGSSGLFNISSNDDFTLTDGQINGTGVFAKTGSGTLNVTGDNSGFTGDFIMTSGSTVVTSTFFDGDNLINGGTLLLSHGSALGANSVINLATAATLEDESAGGITLAAGQLIGTGTFNKTGSGDLNITGDNSGFTGDFVQSNAGSTTYVSGVFFGGDNTISDGTLEIITGGSLASGSTVDLGATSAMNITSTDTMQIANNQVTGTGAINKTGAGTLNISGNNSGFTGDFTQSAGTTVLSGTAFDTTHTISGGNFDIANGGALASSSVIDLATPAVLNLTSSGAFSLAAAKLTGTGTFNKTGSGDLTVAGSNPGFTGDFVQSNGKTIINNELFAGNNTLNGGTLVVNGANAVIANMNNNAMIDMTRNAGYQTLTFTNYTGTNGVIKLNTVLGGNNSNTDKIVINGGNALGVTNLLVLGTGNGAKTTDGIKIVDAIGGATITSGSFSLVGGVVDTGAYEYNLVQGNLTGTDTQSMFLRSTSTQTNVVKTNRNIPGSFLALVKTGMNNLNRRLGDVRDNTDGNVGVWARGYAKHLMVDETINTSMNVYGTEMGADQLVLNKSNQKVLIGLMGGYGQTSDMKIQQTNGFTGQGSVKSFTAGAYATWFTKDGWFADVTGRGFWAHSDMSSFTSQGQDIKYSPERNFFAGSAEFGKQFDIQMSDRTKWIIEPKAEGQYITSSQSDFETNMGTNVHYGKTNSLNARGAVRVAYNHKTFGGTVFEPFVEAGINNEFDGKTDIAYAGNNFKSDVSGVGYEVMAGLNTKIGCGFNTYMDISYESNQVYDAYAGHLGFRYIFGGCDQSNENTKSADAKMYDVEPTKNIAPIQEEYIAPVAATAPVAVAPVGYKKSDIAYQTKSSFFQTGEYKLTPAGRAGLDEFIQSVNSSAPTDLTVIGYTDNVGSAAANKKLSEQRAKSVHDYLVEHGIKTKSLKYIGRGSENPIGFNNTAEGRLKNRRVEIVKK